MCNRVKCVTSITFVFLRGDFYCFIFFKKKINGLEKLENMKCHTFENKFIS